MGILAWQSKYRSATSEGTFAVRNRTPSTQTATFFRANGGTHFRCEFPASFLVRTGARFGVGMCGGALMKTATFWV
ncbi:hypothetical protein KUF71_009388 [Frankliniella fusca]|uniref:Uncharacterized protein n=1 Tax=Frankliniella fusca TaxID=407009 RepID=A0AAE1HG81_9NEOP|nr:hypothetical protein KUF71_009388 [Frankliniella fusca]